VALLSQWRAEKESAWLYGAVAEAEPDDAKSELFAELARAAEEQAKLIADNMAKTHETVPARFRPSMRARLVAVLARAFGPRRVRHALAAMKVRGLSVYSETTAPPPHPLPKSVDDFGSRHRQSAGGLNLRAAVFGINDGLVSNASLVLGVAGAVPDVSTLLVSGVAGLLAGAFSMAAGEYVSVRSQRELYEYQIGLEREELEIYPREEAEELALIYSARGIQLERAREMASTVLTDPDTALRTLAIEELGVNPDELGSPWSAAGSSLIAFAIGALIPLLPLLVIGERLALAAVAAVSALALFGVGAALSLLTGRGAVTGGLRMLAIGSAAAAATYAIGSLLGVALG